MRSLIPLAVLGSCLAPSQPATVSLSACSTGTDRPSVSWYVVPRGHDVWLSIDGAPMWVAKPTGKATTGQLPGYLNDDGRTVDVRVVVDGVAVVRTIWATKACG